MKKLILVPVILALLSVSSLANARGKMLFGTQESIERLSDAEIPGPDNTTLYLGYHKVMKAFLLPYYITNNGYVLGVSGDSSQYIPLTDEMVQGLQKEKALPNPLPKIEMTWFDYLFGYSLWIVIFFVFVVPLLQKKFLKKE